MDTELTTGEGTGRAKKGKRRNYWYAVGRRKTSTARIRIWKKEDGSMEVNAKPLEAYFPTEDLRTLVTSPLKVIGGLDNKVTIRVSGGGKHSQAEGIRHGIARALIEMNADLRPSLKAENMLTRDSRVKERKKYGLKRARRAPQWSKR